MGHDGIYLLFILLFVEIFLLRLTRRQDHGEIVEKLNSLMEKK